MSYPGRTPGAIPLKSAGGSISITTTALGKGGLGMLHKDKKNCISTKSLSTGGCGWVRSFTRPLNIY